MKKKVLIGFLVIVACIVIIMVVDIILNKSNRNFAQLNSIDQQILLEFDEYCKANEEKPLWEEYQLDKKTVVAVNGLLGKSYIINPKKEINNIFTTEIHMPEDSQLCVYRSSRLSPQMWGIKTDPGNFCEIGKTYQVYDNDVYFTKYNHDESVRKINSSNHYTAFISHEAFHYYMQNEWPGGQRFNGTLSDDGLDLLAKEYDVLARIQEELAGGNIDKALLATLAKEYVSIVDERISINPQYVKKELSMETSEGTASYVGIKASQAVGYDLGVMYFDNTKNVSFSEVIPMLNEGKIEKSFLADRMPYETGAQLCFLLDSLEVKEWQQKLNNQTKDNPITLYNLLKEFNTLNN